MFDVTVSVIYQMYGQFVHFNLCDVLFDVDLGSLAFVWFSKLREFSLQLSTFHDIFLIYYHHMIILIRNSWKSVYMWLILNSKAINCFMGSLSLYFSR